MIEKVYGINATSITLNDRFTLLAELVPIRVMRPRKFLVSHPLSNKSYNFRSQNLNQGRAYYLQQNNRQIMKQRLGFQNDSEINLPGLRRANNTSNQLGVKNRVAWQYANGNLRTSTFNIVTGMRYGYGFRLRGPRRLTSGHVRGRGGRQQVGRLRAGAEMQHRMVQTTRGGRGRGQAGRGQGRGAKTAKEMPTKEELDLQLETYMAHSPWALDKELDDYMKDAMDEE